jgi:hypothetical protein
MISHQRAREALFVPPAYKSSKKLIKQSVELIYSKTAVLIVPQHKTFCCSRLISKKKISPQKNTFNLYLTKES